MREERRLGTLRVRTGTRKKRSVWASAWRERSSNGEVSMWAGVKLVLK